MEGFVLYNKTTQELETHTSKTNVHFPPLFLPLLCEGVIRPGAMTLKANAAPVLRVFNSWIV